jgi:hypothetical protein
LSGMEEREKASVDNKGKTKAAASRRAGEG